jgi:hypothetical protein
MSTHISNTTLRNLNRVQRSQFKKVLFADQLMCDEVCKHALAWLESEIDRMNYERMDQRKGYS